MRSRRKSIRILIADRFPVIREGLRHIVANHPEWNVIAEAGNGFEAVRMAVDTRPDVAILGHSLPLLNGVTATANIRRQAPNTEVLIYTTRANETAIRDALNAGAHGYILKSDSDDKLTAAIEALGRHQAYFTEIASAFLLKAISERMRRNGPLSERERAIVQFVAEGRTTEEIAHNFSLHVKTVDRQRMAVMNKLKLTSLAALVRYAVRNHIIEP